jgi:hypothetical protein
MEFKKFKEFIGESLTFLSLDKTMKNEFMNRIGLKQDFETAKRIFYSKASCLFTHISGEEFELRTSANIPNEDMKMFIENDINPVLKNLQFSIKKKPKKDILKDRIWIVKGKIVDTI